VVGIEYSLTEASVALRYGEHVISGRIFPGKFLGETFAFGFHCHVFLDSI
jgi:hypothetical protein